GELLGRLLAFLVRRLIVLLGPANVLVRTSAALVVSNLAARAAVPSVLGVVGGVGVVTLLVGAAALAARRVSILTTTDGGVVRSGAGVRPARVEVGRSTA